MKLKISKSSAEYLDKGGYVLFKNNNFVIINRYNHIKWYIRDLLETLSIPILGILGLITLISFPFILIYTLYQYIPKIHIIDENIDKIELEKQRKANEDMANRFKTKETK